MTIKNDDLTYKNVDSKTKNANWSDWKLLNRGYLNQQKLEFQQWFLGVMRMWEKGRMVKVYHFKNPWFPTQACPKVVDTGWAPPVMFVGL